VVFGHLIAPIVYTAFRPDVTYIYVYERAKTTKRFLS